jgi:hypothetical protein
MLWLESQDERRKQASDTGLNQQKRAAFPPVFPTTCSGAKQQSRQQHSAEIVMCHFRRPGLSADDRRVAVRTPHFGQK